MPAIPLPPSGSIIPEMSGTRLLEYRKELIEEIDRKYTAEIAMTTNLFDFNDLKAYCTRRLGEVTEEIVSRFAALDAKVIELQEQIDEMHNNADYGNHL